MTSTTTSDIYFALCNFADDVTQKLSGIVVGESEEQLRAPFENLMKAVADSLNMDVLCVGETKLPDRLGKPDYGIAVGGLPTGYAELKAPGKGVLRRNFKGHDRNQFDRFTRLPNVLYTDGNSWALYQNGELVWDKIVRLSGDVSQDGRDAVRRNDVERLARLLDLFLRWNPVIPADLIGVNWELFAAQLAPLCRYLRDDVREEMQDKSSPLPGLAAGWRYALFPTASDEQFADAYAQTVVFALLLGRSLGAGDGVGETLTFDNAQAALRSEHSLLSAALRALVDPEVEETLRPGLNAILRLINAVPTSKFSGDADPWLFFYEHFLAEYDPRLRKDAGVYFTPVQVVNAQVRLIDDLLRNRLGKPRGFVDPEVFTLDPAVGTGTYLLGVIQHALRDIADRYGKGAVAEHSDQLAQNLYGFEIMTGAYAVADLRVTNALRGYDASFSRGGAQIYLADTLESPNSKPPQGTWFVQRELSNQQRLALDVKRDVRVLVCLGNPPYDRASAEASAGGWVRHGDDENRKPILDDFIEPARAAGHGIHLKNLYNLYVYFWRWALWKVFEQNENAPGVVSLITAASYLDGNAFAGMREHMRRECDEIWILDLGGDSRGTRKSENVFNIQTPVAIAVAMRKGARKPRQPAKVRYSRIDGSRREKFIALDEIADFAGVEWEDCSDDWQAPFTPAGTGEYFSWPLLTDLMPWQHSGVQAKRGWPIAPDEDTLKRRWEGLLNADDRAVAFREDRDRKVTRSYKGGLDSDPVAELDENTPHPPFVRYGYRSLDRQFIIADRRIISFARPPLWESYSDRQIYFTTLINGEALGYGPALSATSDIPDICHFRGRGGKDALPLYRTADAGEPNITLGLLDMLSETYGHDVTPQDFAAYLYGIMAQPAYTERFYDELGTRQARLPLTKDGALFRKVSEVGARLLRLHTYGERFIPDGEARGIIPDGMAKCVAAVSQNADDYPDKFRYTPETQTLRVGKGEFAPVAPEVYNFQISSLNPLQSWLKYRMKDGGRLRVKSSPLDDIRPAAWTAQFTRELLELIWTLEATLAVYPEQEKLLDDVIGGELLTASELPMPTDGMRKPPPPPAAAERLI